MANHSKPQYPTSRLVNHHRCKSLRTFSHQRQEFGSSTFFILFLRWASPPCWTVGSEGLKGSPSKHGKGSATVTGWRSTPILHISELCYSSMLTETEKCHRDKEFYQNQLPNSSSLFPSNGGRNYYLTVINRPPWTHLNPLPHQSQASQSSSTRRRSCTPATAAIGCWTNLAQPAPGPAPASCSKAAKSCAKGRSAK